MGEYLCGHHIRQSDIDELQPERFEVIPKEPSGGVTFLPEEDKGLLETVKEPVEQLVGAGSGFTIGKRLELPNGTPRRFPPYPGASRQWSDRTKIQVNRVRRKAPGIVCATYNGHGRTGERWGIDIMVAPFNQKAGRRQEALGDAISDWVIRNWGALHINYIIWWNWMNDGAGWFDYEPLRVDWIRQSGSSPDVQTSRHLDHVHLQINNPHIAGNE